MKLANILGVALISISLVQLACEVNPNPQFLPILIHSITPDRGKHGDVVTINGSGFSPKQANSSVAFDDQQVDIVSWEETRIEIVVPLGMPPQHVDVVVTSLGHSSDPVTFEILPGGLEIVWEKPYTNPNAVAWHPGGQTIATGDSRGGLHLWSSELQPIRSVTGTLGLGISKLGWSPDGQRLGALSQLGFMRIWKIGVTEDTRSPLDDVQNQNNEPIEQFEWGPGNLVAAGTVSGNVIVGDFTDVQAPQFVTAFNVDAAGVLCMHWLSEVSLATVGVAGNSVDVWDLNFEPPVAQSLPITNVNDAAFCAGNSQELTVFNTDGHFSLFDLSLILPLSHGQISIAGAKRISSNGDFLVVQENDIEVSVWSLLAFEMERLFSFPSSDVIASTISAQGSHTLIVFKDFSFSVFDVVTGRQEALQSSHADMVFDAVEVPALDLIASASNDGAIKFWEKDSGRYSGTLLGHSQGVMSLDWSIEQGRLLSAGRDGRVVIWGSEWPFEPETVLDLHTEPVWSAQWDPGGGQIYSAGWDGRVYLHTVAAGSTELYFQHGAAIISSDWSTDRSRIALGTQDGLVIVLDAETRNQVFVYNSHEGPVYDIQFSTHDPDVLVSAGLDGTIRLWNCESGEEIDLLRTQYAVNRLSWNEQDDIIAIATLGEMLLWKRNGQNNLAISSRGRWTQTAVFTGDTVFFAGEESFGLGKP